MAKNDIAIYIYLQKYCYTKYYVLKTDSLHFWHHSEYTNMVILNINKAWFKTIANDL